MNIKEYIQDNILLTDGAMGTYFSSKMNNYTHLAEQANIEHPEIIEEIHNEYIEAGAKLIRTNTFAANQIALNCSREELEHILEAGYNIAKKCTKEKGVFVACSIGPIDENDREYEEVLNEYYFIIDTFLKSGALIFLFETFSHINFIKVLVPYILSKNQQAQIMVQFTVNAYGYTNSGISKQRILEEMNQIEGLVAYGFNCSIGAGHLYNIVKKIDNVHKMPLMVAPNAGYPDKIYNRTIYKDNAEYFAEVMMDICNLGIKIIGGCCGTTPNYIYNIAQRLKNTKITHIVKQSRALNKKKLNNKITNKFHDKLEKNEFVIIVELDPPFGYDISRLMEAANILKAEGVDLLTIADSPLGKARLDSVIMASKIKREVAIDVMPHICCRDKNTIAIRSQMQAGYVEGLRNYLLVTGDPIPQESRNEINGVFNLNSIKLMQLVKEFNSELQSDTYYYGGALNPKRANLDKVIERVLRKKAAGAKFLLTQPIYREEDIETIKIIKEKTDVKILVGILPLVSYRNARFIHNEFTGMNIPKEIMNSFKPDMTREEAEEVGIDISVKVAHQLKDHVDGLYFMTPFNRATMISKILKRIKTRKLRDNH